MASSADAIGVPMFEWEEGVVAGGQSCRQPGGRSVAGRAGSRPARRHVIRIRGSGEVLLVAAITCSRRTGKDIVDVAQNAGNRGMRTRQRERRVVVIEGCPAPVGGGVARIAGRGEACRGMRGVVGSGPIRLMAPVAGSRQRGVVVVHVAGSAGHGGMCARQWKRSGVVIEG